jgi:hypothetical protein
MEEINNRCSMMTDSECSGLLTGGKTLIILGVDGKLNITIISTTLGLQPHYPPQTRKVCRVAVVWRHLSLW